MPPPFWGLGAPHMQESIDAVKGSYIVSYYSLLINREQFFFLIRHFSFRSDFSLILNLRPAIMKSQAMMERVAHAEALREPGRVEAGGGGCANMASEPRARTSARASGVWPR